MGTAGHGAGGGRRGGRGWGYHGAKICFPLVSVFVRPCVQRKKVLHDREEIGPSVKYQNDRLPTATPGNPFFLSPNPSF